jgi:hypothetical protein
MSKAVYIKLAKSAPNAGPFTIYDSLGNVLANNVSMKDLIGGVAYSVNNDINYVIVESKGRCKFKKTIFIDDQNISLMDYANIIYTQNLTGCIWRHLKNPQIYNTYYGETQPYIIEYPFAYKYYDEILQNVKDYTKVYQYLPDQFGVFDDNRKIQLDNAWFNKAVLYNDQQSSGLLELVAKPMNNLKEYMKYPTYNVDSKTITYTKSDNFYQYNTFWSLVKDKKELLFTKTCESLSLDKVVNQANMDYGKRSYRKEPLRAKDLKVRHILDNRSDIHLVSQFIVTPTQISFK